MLFIHRPNKVELCAARCQKCNSTATFYHPTLSSRLTQPDNRSRLKVLGIFSGQQLANSTSGSSRFRLNRTKCAPAIVRVTSASLVDRFATRAYVRKSSLRCSNRLHPVTTLKDGPLQCSSPRKEHASNLTGCWAATQSPATDIPHSSINSSRCQ
jgi:hypothetical protein